MKTLVLLSLFTLTHSLPQLDWVTLTDCPNCDWATTIEGNTLDHYGAEATGRQLFVSIGGWIPGAAGSSGELQSAGILASDGTTLELLDHVSCPYDQCPYGHATAILGGAIYVYGGTLSVFGRRTWKTGLKMMQLLDNSQVPLSTGVLQWEPVQLLANNEAPGDRFQHTMVAMGGGLVMYGGRQLGVPVNATNVNTYKQQLTEVFVMDLTVCEKVFDQTTCFRIPYCKWAAHFQRCTEGDPKRAWRKLVIVSDSRDQPVATKGHAAVVYNNKMYVSGGFNFANGKLTAGLWELSLGENMLSGESPTGSWRQLCGDPGLVLCSADLPGRLQQTNDQPPIRYTEPVLTLGEYPFPRAYHRLVAVKDGFLLWGGTPTPAYMPETPEPQQQQPPGNTGRPGKKATPQSRSQHSYMLQKRLQKNREVEGNMFEEAWLHELLLGQEEEQTTQQQAQDVLEGDYSDYFPMAKQGDGEESADLKFQSEAYKGSQQQYSSWDYDGWTPNSGDYPYYYFYEYAMGYCISTNRLPSGTGAETNQYSGYDTGGSSGNDDGRTSVELLALQKDRQQMKVANHNRLLELQQLDPERKRARGIKAGKHHTTQKGSQYKPDYYQYQDQYGPYSSGDSYPTIEQMFGVDFWDDYICPCGGRALESEAKIALAAATDLSTMCEHSEYIMDVMNYYYCYLNMHNMRGRRDGKIDCSAYSNGQPPNQYNQYDPTQYDQQNYDTNYQPNQNHGDDDDRAIVMPRSFWLYDMQAERWRKVETSTPQSPRRNYGLALADNNLYILGGVPIDGKTSSDPDYTNALTLHVEALLTSLTPTQSSTATTILTTTPIPTHTTTQTTTVTSVPTTTTTPTVLPADEEPVNENNASSPSRSSAKNGDDDGDDDNDDTEKSTDKDDREDTNDNTDDDGSTQQPTYITVVRQLVVSGTENEHPLNNLAKFQPILIQLKVLFKASDGHFLPDLFCFLCGRTVVSCAACKDSTPQSHRRYSKLTVAQTDTSPEPPVQGKWLLALQLENVSSLIVEDRSNQATKLASSGTWADLGIVDVNPGSPEDILKEDNNSPPSPPPPTKPVEDKSSGFPLWVLSIPIAAIVLVVCMVIVLCVWLRISRRNAIKEMGAQRKQAGEPGANNINNYRPREPATLREKITNFSAWGDKAPTLSTTVTTVAALNRAQDDIASSTITPSFEPGTLTSGASTTGTASTEPIVISLTSTNGRQYRRLKDILGEGTFGKVFKGIDEATGQLVAMKQIADNVDALDRELTTMQQLDHPNVVKCFGVCKTNISSGDAYLVIEYCANGSLSTLLKTLGPLPYPLFASVAHQTLQAMKYLADQNLTHRDIKPGNILLTDTGAVKLGDFGTAKLTATTHTSTTTLAGTLLFMAPEAGNGQATPACDIWSLGLTFYQLLTGRTPWQQMIDAQFNDIQIYLKMSTGKLLPDKPNNIPDELWDLIVCCLKHTPEERWTPAQLLQHPALLKFAEQPQPAASAPIAPHNEQHPVTSLHNPNPTPGSTVGNSNSTGDKHGPMGIPNANTEDKVVTTDENGKGGSGSQSLSWTNTNATTGTRSDGWGEKIHIPFSLYNMTTADLQQQGAKK